MRGGNFYHPHFAQATYEMRITAGHSGALTADWAHKLTGTAGAGAWLICLTIGIQLPKGPLSDGKFIAANLQFIPAFFHDICSEVIARTGNPLALIIWQAD